MKKRIKVLLAGVKAGGGHISLRDFLYQQLETDQETFRNVSWTHPGEALETADHLIHSISPFLYELTYFFSPRYLSDISTIATFNFLRECYKVLKSEKPDIVLSTHFVLSLHFSLAKRLLRSKAVIVNCIPDYGPPSKIMHPRLPFFRSDRLMVFEEWTRKGSAQQYKVPEEDILLAGFNPKKVFAQTAAKYKTKRDARLQLMKVLDYMPYTQMDPDKTTVLVSAGAVDSRKTFKLLKILAREQKNDPSLIDRYQFLVITGRDMKYFERISGNSKKVPVLE
ncbi:MAG: hypothetical protein TR69_WS6001000348 [candidate division WS6 bacterium OLB20]|uniref:Diacylglycerol glucosyltransferase N-terminal domain-containing protein n=1 Tax=candidate division WS6 bacterium OLB20 TaxID=1617426 RepID=A0A136M0P8_9BACT|nr:MAG: hypothetical protein TR69_WS6001000348 [candidate division WS6 bacterium OLB20]